MLSFGFLDEGQTAVTFPLAKNNWPLFFFNSHPPFYLDLLSKKFYLREVISVLLSFHLSRSVLILHASWDLQRKNKGSARLARWKDKEKKKKIGLVSYFINFIRPAVFADLKSLFFINFIRRETYEKIFPFRWLKSDNKSFILSLIEWEDYSKKMIKITLKIYIDGFYDYDINDRFLSLNLIGQWRRRWNICSDQDDPTEQLRLSNST